MRTLTQRPPARRLYGSGRRAPLIPLLPVAYRGSYVRRLLTPRRPVERALLSVIQQTYLAGSSTRTIDALAEYIAAEQRIGRGDPQISPRVFASVLTGACFSSASVEYVFGESAHGLEPDKYARALARALWAGMAPRQEDTP